MRTLLLTGTAIAALMTGLAAASAQTAEQPRQPNARQERQDAGSPGRSESAPGQNRPAADTAAPGRSESAPGQNRPQADTNAPGKSESAPGQNRTTTGAAGDDQNNRRQGQNADQNNRRQSQTGEESRRDRTPGQAQGEDRERNPALRGEERNRNAAGERDGDRNRRQADDQQGRDTNPALRTGERDGDRTEDRKRQADDLQNRDRNRQADDQQGRDRDRNRQAGDDRDRDRPDMKLSVKLKGEEKTKITASLVERAKPIEKTKIKFNINVGTTVPRGSVELYELPPTVITVVPEYRSYRYFVVEDEIVIVEPSTYRIVEVIERDGGSRATGAARLTIDRSKFSLIKRELRPRGEVKVRFTVREGAVLPDDVELWDVPQTVVTEVPELRSYRYVVYQNEVILVEPQTRRIVEVID